MVFEHLLQNHPRSTQKEKKTLSVLEIVFPKKYAPFRAAADVRQLKSVLGRGIRREVSGSSSLSPSTAMSWRRRRIRSNIVKERQKPWSKGHNLLRSLGLVVPESGHGRLDGNFPISGSLWTFAQWHVVLCGHGKYQAWYWSMSLLRKTNALP